MSGLLARHSSVRSIISAGLKSWRRPKSLAPIPVNRAANMAVESLEGRQLLSAGTLDAGFGTGGIVNDGSLPAVAHMAIQSDGKVVVVGSSPGGLVSVSRYDTDGTLDSTFGGGGTVTTNFGSDGAARDVAIESSGVIVVGGTSGFNIALAAFNSNGTVDVSFGGAGFITENIGSNAEADTVLITSAGKILIAGNVEGGGIVAARFSATGALDTPFGTSGYTIISPSGGLTFTDAALASDGSIVLVGANSSSGEHFYMTRLTAGGTPDGTVFGAHDPTGSNLWGGVAVDSLGRIDTAGADNGMGAVARYLSRGYVDRSFGTSGEALYNPGAGNTAEFMHVLVQSDGTILASGVETPASGPDESLLVRFLPNGQLDTTFGTDGAVLTTFSGSSTNQFNDVALDEGDIVAAGGSPGTDEENIAAYDDGTSLTQPTAALATISEIRSTARSLSFTVVYHAQGLIDQSTLGDTNILVTGPHGFARYAKLTTVGRERTGGTLSVIYTITPTGGFTSSTNGTYAVTLEALHVLDSYGNYVAGGTLGTFVVDI